jgi:hypothetical protein
MKVCVISSILLISLQCDADVVWVTVTRERVTLCSEWRADARSGDESSDSLQNWQYMVRLLLVSLIIMVSFCLVRRIPFRITVASKVLWHCDKNTIFNLITKSTRWRERTKTFLKSYYVEAQTRCVIRGKQWGKPGVALDRMVSDLISFTGWYVSFWGFCGVMLYFCALIFETGLVLTVTYHRTCHHPQCRPPCTLPTF